MRRRKSSFGIVAGKHWSTAPARAPARVRERPPTTETPRPFLLRSDSQGRNFQLPATRHQPASSVRLEEIAVDLIVRGPPGGLPLLPFRPPAWATTKQLKQSFDVKVPGGCGLYTRPLLVAPRILYRDNLYHNRPAAVRQSAVGALPRMTATVQLSRGGGVPLQF